MKQMNILIQSCALCVGIYSNKSSVRKLLHSISQHLYFSYHSLILYVEFFFCCLFFPFYRRVKSQLTHYCAERQLLPTSPSSKLCNIEVMTDRSSHSPHWQLGPSVPSSVTLKNGSGNTSEVEIIF